MNKTDEMNLGYLQFLTNESIPDIEKWAGAVSGWEAVYLPNVGGNMTAVHLSDGTGLYLAWSLKRMYLEFNEFLGVNPKSTRESFRRFMGGSQNPPIVVPERKTVYVALKTRSYPHSKHDGAIGYIATKHITGIEPTSMGKTHIHLIGGQSMLLAIGSRTVTHHILKGEAFQANEWYRHANELNLL